MKEKIEVQSSYLNAIVPGQEVDTTTVHVNNVGKRHDATVEEHNGYNADETRQLRIPA